MTSLNFKLMMKEARKTAISEAKSSNAELETGLEQEMQIALPVPVETSDYIVEKFEKYKLI